jgi:organic radical activating enzyme
MKLDFQYPHPYIKLEYGQDFYKDHFVINWNLNNVCNYSCSYCSPKLYDGSVKTLPIEVIKNFIQKIFDEKGYKVFFEFTGGEVTFYPRLSELLLFIKSFNGSVGIISNGSQSLDWWENNKELLDHACLSFHGERGRAEQFYQVIKALYDTTTLHLNFMMLPSKFEEIYSFAQIVANDFERMSVALQPLFENFKGAMYKYTDTQLELLKNPSFYIGPNYKYQHRPEFKRKIYRGEMKKIFADGKFEVADPTLLISNKKNSWFGWNCNIGVENLVIDPLGYVFRGTCLVGGCLGNIQKPDFKLPTESVKCIRKKCECAFDLMSTKTL